MSSILITFLTVVEVIVCLLLILTVLMQRPRQEGLGAAFGGDMTSQMFGAQTTNVLQKFTVYLAVALFILTAVLAVLVSKKQAGETKKLFTAPPAAEAPATPAAAAPGTPETAPAAPAPATPAAPAVDAPKTDAPAAPAPPAPAEPAMKEPGAAPAPTPAAPKPEEAPKPEAKADAAPAPAPIIPVAPAPAPAAPSGN